MSFQLEALLALRQSIVNYKTDESWQSMLYTAQINNQWFELKQTEKSIQSWIDALSDENIDQWLSKYSFPLEIHNKRIKNSQFFIIRYKN